MKSLLTTECRPPWLIARFEQRQRLVSWSLNRPGFVEADTVAWLQVSDADLPIGEDPKAFLERRLAEQNIMDAVGLMTAREVQYHHLASSGDHNSVVETLVTLGLTNGVELDSMGRQTNVQTNEAVGTINMLIAVSLPLTEGAMLEALSIATMARTAALLTANRKIVGTGTDCIVVACPIRPTGETFAGLHTDIGQHITMSVFQALGQALREWESQNHEVEVRAITVG